MSEIAISTLSSGGEQLRAVPSTPVNVTQHPAVKALEGNNLFQRTKIAQPEQTLSGEDFPLTYCDVTDFTVRPFGNLFASLNLPITPAQRTEAAKQWANTALAGLATIERVVVGEIPRGRYGELIDGKSLVIRLPIQVGGDSQTATLYGGYYEFNTNLNNQYSDTNGISGSFGVLPQPSNDYNSNVAYLFCNEIDPPKDTVSNQTLRTGNITVNSRSTQAIPVNIPAGATVRTPLATLSGSQALRVRIPGLGDFPLVDAIVPGSLTGTSFRLRQEVSHLVVVNDAYNAVTVDATVYQVLVSSTRSWSAWTPSNRYPLTPSGTGKAVANLRDPSGNGRVDEPVGLVYLDKGLVVLTHPLLVENLSREQASAANPAQLTDPDPVPVDPVGPYTKMRYLDGTARCSVTYRSVATEYKQSYVCMLSVGEFTKTSNPTFSLAYPGSAPGEAKLYITELGLYNEDNVLMAIAKPSVPLEKTANRPRVFTVDLLI
jgi:hypothetical protein